jgi:hypothetical protein
VPHWGENGLVFAFAPKIQTSFKEGSASQVKHKNSGKIEKEQEV